MSQSDIRRALRRHNGVQIAAGLFLIPMAIGAWYVSYRVLYVLFRIPLAALEVNNAGQIANYIAIGGLVLLVLEGIRQGGELFGLREYGESGWASSPYAETRGGRVFGVAVFGPLVGMGYFITQVLFCAPSTTVAIPRFFRSLIRANATAIAQAAEVREELARRREWIPVEEFRERAAGVFLLARMKLVWTRIENGRAEVRIPPGEGNV